MQHKEPYEAPSLEVVQIAIERGVMSLALLEINAALDEAPELENIIFGGEF